MEDGRGSGAVCYQFSNGIEDSMNFETAYNLKEETQKQIKNFREIRKESRLTGCLQI